MKFSKGRTKQVETTKIHSTPRYNSKGEQTFRNFPPDQNIEEIIPTTRETTP